MDFYRKYLSLFVPFGSKPLIKLDNKLSFIKNEFEEERISLGLFNENLVGNREIHIKLPSKINFFIIKYNRKKFVNEESLFNFLNETLYNLNCPKAYFKDLSTGNIYSWCFIKPCFFTRIQALTLKYFSKYDKTFKKFNIIANNTCPLPFNNTYVPIKDNGTSIDLLNVDIIDKLHAITEYSRPNIFNLLNIKQDLSINITNDLSINEYYLRLIIREFSYKQSKLVFKFLQFIKQQITINNNIFFISKERLLNKKGIGLNSSNYLYILNALENNFNLIKKLKTGSPYDNSCTKYEWIGPSLHLDFSDQKYYNNLAKFIIENNSLKNYSEYIQKKILLDLDGI